MRDITCKTYSARDGAKSPRCRHFKKGGYCSLKDNKRCIEWLKVNRRDLFGHPLPQPEEPKPKTENRKQSVEPRKQHTPKAQKAEPAGSNEAIPVFRNITDEEIESFKKLNVEVCLKSDDLGEIWLVAQYSESNRNEISIEHAATLAVLCGAFEGTRVTRFKKIKERSA